MRPSFRSNCYPEIKKCSLIYICWYLAGVTAVSGMEYFCPAFYCNLEEEELYPLQWVQISSAFLLKAWQAGSFKFVSTTEFINFTSNQVYHHDLNLVPAWAKMWTWRVGELWLVFSALLRLLWMDRGYSLGHRLCRNASSLNGKTACAIKGENRLMSCRQSVQSTALCVPGGVSLGHSVCTALAGKIPFPYFFVLTCSRVLPGKDSYLSQWSCCPFNLNNNRGFSRHP